MGTPQIPNKKTAALKQATIVADTPRLGVFMWVILLSLFIPPGVVTLIGNLSGGLPHQTFWVILLCIPMPVVLLSLPYKYRLDPKQLVILGLFYRVRISRENILWIRPVNIRRVLLHFGSIFCSDPKRALEVKKKTGSSIMISPSNPEPFLYQLNLEHPIKQNNSYKS